jgi:hypothetical protein
MAPSAGFMPGLGPTIFSSELYVPDLAGRALVRHHPDQATGTIAQLYFYGAKNDLADPKAYDENVKINTPLTTDAQGNLYFGFLAEGGDGQQ